MKKLNHENIKNYTRIHKKYRKYFSYLSELFAITIRNAFIMYENDQKTYKSEHLLTKYDIIYFKIY